MSRTSPGNLEPHTGQKRERHVRFITDRNLRNRPVPTVAAYEVCKKVLIEPSPSRFAFVTVLAYSTPLSPKARGNVY